MFSKQFKPRQDKCAHRNGWLSETMLSYHVRDIEEGTLAEEGNNEQGDIIYYLYHCNDCDREWRYKAYPKLKWLQRIHDQLRSNF